MPDDASHMDKSFDPNINLKTNAVFIHTLGQFNISINNKRLNIKHKQSTKPVELLKAIIAFDGCQVRIELLIDSLWPDAEGDSAWNSFSMTLSRLRRLLGKNQFVQMADGKISLNKSYIWLDTWTFEYYSQASETNKLRQAVEIYHGDFLSGELNDRWTLSKRLRLKRKFVRCILKLGKHFEQQNKWDLAIDLYEHALGLDDLSEPVYQRLIYCYGQMDLNGEAIRLFLNFKHLLEAQLGVCPSMNTRQLIDQITASSHA